MDKVEVAQELLAAAHPPLHVDLAVHAARDHNEEEAPANNHGDNHHDPAARDCKRHMGGGQKTGRKVGA